MSLVLRCIFQFLYLWIFGSDIRVGFRVVEVRTRKDLNV